MSTFSGYFKSMPGVRCDRFDELERKEDGAKPDQFFLSHTHSDHMKGIDELGRHLKRKGNGPKINNKLYCSSIAKAFVLSRNKGFPEKAIVELLPNEPKTVTVYDSNEMYFVKVTAIGANHCPGSFMFLFERLDSAESKNTTKRILYTGDFRFEESERTPNPLPMLKSLHNQLGEPLEIDELFLDTTFCNTEWMSFPSRFEAEQKIWEQCEKWIKKNGIYKNTRNKHVILLKLPARYGYERILQTIYEKSNRQRLIHVNADKFGEYMCKEDLSTCVTPDPNKAPWIHACTHINKDDEKKGKMNRMLLNSLPCTQGEFEVCQIKACAMYFTTEVQKRLEHASPDRNRVMSLSEGDFYRICYSTHSSLTEIRDFVQYFAPKNIVPCVVPKRSSKSQVEYFIQNMIRQEIPEMLSDAESQPFEAFSPVKAKKREAIEYDSLDLLDLSPAKKKAKVESQQIDPSTETPEAAESRVSFDPYSHFDESINWLNDESSDDEPEREGGEGWFDPAKPRGWNSIEVIPGIIKQELPDTKRRHASLTIIPSSSCTILPSSVSKLPNRLPDPISSEGTSSSSNSITLSLVGKAGEEEASTLSRRQTFARSKTDKTYYSMPLCQELELNLPKERRFSMPSNMKLPLIKVTPSSPSPDPDDPDYPEFFQDRIYLEHVTLKLEGSTAASTAAGQTAASTAAADQTATGTTATDQKSGHDSTAEGGFAVEEEDNEDLNLTLEDSSSSGDISVQTSGAPTPPMQTPRRIKRQQSMFKCSLDYDDTAPKRSKANCLELHERVVIIPSPNTSSENPLGEVEKSTRKRKSSVIFSRITERPPDKSEKGDIEGLDDVKIDPSDIIAKITTTGRKILVPDSDEEDVDDDDAKVQLIQEIEIDDNVVHKQNLDYEDKVKMVDNVVNYTQNLIDDEDEDIGAVQDSQYLINDEEENNNLSDEDDVQETQGLTKDSDCGAATMQGSQKLVNASVNDHRCVNVIQETQELIKGSDCEDEIIGTVHDSQSCINDKVDGSQNLANEDDVCMVQETQKLTKDSYGDNKTVQDSQYLINDDDDDEYPKQEDDGGHHDDKAVQETSSTKESLLKGESRRAQNSQTHDIEDLLKEAIEGNYDEHIIQNIRAQVEIHRNVVQID